MYIYIYIHISAERGTDAHDLVDAAFVDDEWVVPMATSRETLDVRID